MMMLIWVTPDGSNTTVQKAGMMLATNNADALLHPLNKTQRASSRSVPMLSTVFQCALAPLGTIK